MADPWLSIVGLGEDGLTGLAPASRKALAAAEFVFGGPRHLALVDAGARGRAWPVPFDVTPVLTLRGRQIVVLASGDPFWFGAGGSLIAHLKPGEWVSHPAPSTFALAANTLGWRLEEVGCHGLHAASFEAVRHDLVQGRRLICLVRDGSAVGQLAAWLCARAAGASRLHVLERLGGPHGRVRSADAFGFALEGISAPVAVAVEVAGPPAPRRTPGLPDDAFAHEGQITRQAIRALTLCALAPRQGARLWDLGAGSGSISVEWALQGGVSLAVEARADRVALIDENIARFGLGGCVTVLAARFGAVLPAALLAAPRPDAVFLGGGADTAVLSALQQTLRRGTRLVANAVTLETEAVLTDAQTRMGGELLRIDISRAEPLGGMRGWMPARPVVQWRVTL